MVCSCLSLKPVKESPVGVGICTDSARGRLPTDTQILTLLAFGVESSPRVSLEFPPPGLGLLCFLIGVGSCPKLSLYGVILIFVSMSIQLFDSVRVSCAHPL